MSAAPPTTSSLGRNQLSRNLPLVKPDTQFRTYEAVVNRSTTDGSVTSFIAEFPKIPKIVKVELVEYQLRGVPLSGSGPDYAYYRLELGQLSGGEYASGTAATGLHLLTGNSQNPHEKYSNPRLMKYIDTPVQLDRLPVKVYLPSGDLAVSGTDLTGINLIFRITQDLNKASLR